MATLVEFKEEAGCRRHLEITVSKEEVAPLFNDILAEFAKQAKVPGFRPGKAPKQIVESRFSKELSEELIRRAVSKAFQEVIKSKDIKPISEPMVEHVDYKKGEKLDFHVHVEVAPSIALPNYSGIEVKSESVVVTDKEMDEAIQNILTNYANEVPKNDPQILAINDVVFFDYKVLVEGKVIEAKELTRMHLAEQALTKEILNAFIGMKIGDEKDIDLTLPPTYFKKEYANKKATYHVKIQEIKVKELPELDVEFIKNFGEFQDVEAFKNHVKDDLENTKERINKAQMKKQIFDILSGSSDFEVPGSIMYAQIESIAPDIQKKWTEAGKNLQDELIQKEFKAYVEKEAIHQVRAAFILDKIAKNEKIEISNQEIKEHIYVLAEQYHIEPSQLEQRLVKEQQIQRIKQRLLDEKVLKFILENAKISA